MADTTLTGVGGDQVKAFSTGGTSKHQSAVLAVDGVDGSIRADKLRGVTVDDCATGWSAGGAGNVQVIEDDATPERLNGGTQLLCKGVMLGHGFNNTGRIAFGSANTVRATDAALNTPTYIEFGGPPIIIRIDDPAKIWAAVAVDGDTVIWAALF